MTCPACQSDRTCYLADGLWRCLTCGWIFETGDLAIVGGQKAAEVYLELARRKPR